MAAELPDLDPAALEEWFSRKTAMDELASLRPRVLLLERDDGEGSGRLLRVVRVMLAELVAEIDRFIDGSGGAASPPPG